MDGDMDNDEDLTPTATLAKLYEDQGFFGKAVSVYRKLLNMEPGRADLRRALESVERRLSGPKSRPVQSGPENSPGPVIQLERVAAEGEKMFDQTVFEQTDEKPGKILVIHGPNLNMLGRREPSVYGNATLEEIDKEIEKAAADCGMTVKTFQSNHEGEIVEKIHEALEGYDALIINPAAYTHTSIAIKDALLMLEIPIIEVHLSNVHGREPLRHTSMIADVATGQVIGFGKDSYVLAVIAAARMTGHASLGAPQV
jgi:3-dehydroquinate dehydratase-2